MYPMYQFPQMMPQINARFVTCVEEARASMIDGYSTNIFLDTSTGKIYLKKLNNNGLADFLVYTTEERADPLAEINTRLTKIENYLGGKDESISEPIKPAIAKQNERYDATESTGLPTNERNDQWQERR